MNIQAIKTTVTQFAGRTGLTLRKYSPEILIGIGIVSTITAVASAVIATKKTENVMIEHDSEIESLKTDYGITPDVEGDVSLVLNDQAEKNYKKELTKIYLHTGVELVKVYTPTVMFTTMSIASFLGAYGIVHKRNVALTAAYTAVSEAFKSYRNAVVEELGEEKDDQFRHGLALKNEVSDDGTVETKLKPVDDFRDYSQYAVFFDESSRNWSNSPEHNLAFLKCQQNYCNQLLRINGHLFLNEVYDRLDIPRTQAGALVGWVLGEGNENTVDFGIYDGSHRKARDFVNGYETNILLDFNVDGPIFDLI